ncbi:unnamed protein product, partial [marine sediment metagenome]
MAVLPLTATPAFFTRIDFIPDLEIDPAGKTYFVVFDLKWAATAGLTLQSQIEASGITDSSTDDDPVGNQTSGTTTIVAVEDT